MLFFFGNYNTFYLLLCSTINIWNAIDGNHNGNDDDNDEDDVHCSAILDSSQKSYSKSFQIPVSNFA